MKTFITAAAAMLVCAGAFAQGAANPTNEGKIAPAKPAVGPAAAGTSGTGTAAGRINSVPAGTAKDPSNEASISGAKPAHGPESAASGAMGAMGGKGLNNMKPVPAGTAKEQSTELKIGPAKPAHGPGSAK